MAWHSLWLQMENKPPNTTIKKQLQKTPRCGLKSCRFRIELAIFHNKKAL
jgi:hypothetical protein